MAGERESAFDSTKQMMSHIDCVAQDTCGQTAGYLALFLLTYT